MKFLLSFIFLLSLNSFAAIQSLRLKNPQEIKEFLINPQGTVAQLTEKESIAKFDYSGIKKATSDFLTRNDTHHTLISLGEKITELDMDYERTLRVSYTYSDGSKVSMNCTVGPNPSSFLGMRSEFNCSF